MGFPALPPPPDELTISRVLSLKGPLQRIFFLHLLVLNVQFFFALSSPPSSISDVTPAHFWLPLAVGIRLWRSFPFHPVFPLNRDPPFFILVGLPLVLYFEPGLVLFSLYSFPLSLFFESPARFLRFGFPKPPPHLPPRSLVFSSFPLVTFEFPSFGIGNRGSMRALIVPSSPCGSDTRTSPYNALFFRAPHSFFLFPPIFPSCLCPDSATICHFGRGQVWGPGGMAIFSGPSRYAGTIFSFFPPPVTVFVFLLTASLIHSSPSLPR